MASTSTKTSTQTTPKQAKPVAAAQATATKPESIGWYYQLAFFIIIACLQSVPRFLFEIGQPIQVIPRIVLLGLFFIVAWFFTFSLHEKFNWNVLSGLFLLEMGVGVALAILLFLQLYSLWFVYVGLFVLLVRAAAYSYVVSHRLPHLRLLVFCTGFFLLAAGEIMLLAKLLPAA